MPSPHKYWIQMWYSSGLNPYMKICNRLTATHFRLPFEASADTYGESVPSGIVPWPSRDQVWSETEILLMDPRGTLCFR